MACAVVMLPTQADIGATPRRLDSKGENRVSISGSSILVTGATGSFGKAFLGYALANLDPQRIVVFSRDELKQYEVRQMFGDDPRLRFFIGDIRDRDRLARAMHGCD